MSPVARIPHHPALAQSHSFAPFSPPPPQVDQLDRVRCKDAYRSGGTVVELLLAPIILGIMELVRLPCPATRIHQPDNSGHVTPAINWTDPQIEFQDAKRKPEEERATLSLITLLQSGSIGTLEVNLMVPGKGYVP